MDQRINLSRTAIVMTVIVFCLLTIFTAVNFKEGERLIAFTLLGIGLVIIVPALFYAPISSGANDDYVYVRHPLRTSRFPISQISSAEPFEPTMAEKCVIGSRGCLGYWGFFYDGGVQKYVAYYGKASECVLLTMNNGRKFLIGAHDRDAFADYINKKIATRL